MEVSTNALARDVNVWSVSLLLGLFAHRFHRRITGGNALARDVNV
jgi:hypothetical protein